MTSKRQEGIDNWGARKARITARSARDVEKDKLLTLLWEEEANSGAWEAAANYHKSNEYILKADKKRLEDYVVHLQTYIDTINTENRGLKSQLSAVLAEK